MQLTPYTLHHADGSLRKQGQHLDGEKHGEWRTWHPTGQLASISHFSLGLATGEWRSYYPDGQLKAIRSFENGKEHGRREVHYRKRYWIEDFKHGVKHGLWQEWEGEHLRKQGEYRDGLEEGEWSEFGDAGEVLSLKVFEQGKLIKRIV